MNETTFENAKVGDRVWDSGFGWGAVNGRQDNAPYPLAVWFNDGRCLGYLFNGHSKWNTFRTLFWDEVKFEAPPRPKRKIKKVIEGWVFVYDDNSISCTLYPTLEYALKARGGLFEMPVGEPLFIHHEYEVEE